MNKSVWGGGTGRAALRETEWGRLVYTLPSPLLACYPSLPQSSSLSSLISHKQNKSVLPWSDGSVDWSIVLCAKRS